MGEKKNILLILNDIALEYGNVAYVTCFFGFSSIAGYENT